MGVLKWTRRFSYGDALAQCVSTNEVVYAQTMKRSQEQGQKHIKREATCKLHWSRMSHLSLILGKSLQILVGSGRIETNKHDRRNNKFLSISPGRSSLRNREAKQMEHTYYTELLIH
ncbi:uncharacterized protein LOC124659378 isoform X1 [Lolium rigidum]|uniref:uncharacterized protein LOC124659378 isoform X1 n=1 Tax=Lolium rigidum TaxID=89674 RepID=UPI001F5CAC6F|nr:uncharacterized protein LOC124659378 isoform X1 [Lolium rigidum]